MIVFLDTKNILFGAARVHKNSNRRVYQVPAVATPTVAMVVAIVAVWSSGLIGYVNGVLPLSLSFVFTLLAAYAAFTGFHDASHFALGKKRWVSVVAGELLGVILVANFQVFRQIHQRHHRHTMNTQSDPDTWLSEGPVGLLLFRWLVVDFHYIRAFKPSQLKLKQLEAIAMCTTCILAGALVAALILTGNMIALIALWIVPARISLVCAAYYANYVPHQRPNTVCREGHTITHTANIRGRFLGLLLIGHNMHLVHHLYPGVPFYQCFEIWRRRRSELLVQGAREVPLTRPFPSRKQCAALR
ncbi:MAG: fatty acid desaturase [Planctomycetota bacterium]|nr:fatty acid desaturase [Planctomycetota bacterium]